LLGTAYAKDKSIDDYPLNVTAVVVNGSTGNLYADCFMSLSDGHIVYNISSNGFCKSAGVGDRFRARVYNSKWGITIIEIAYYHKGGFKTAKYRVNSQILVANEH
jgi:hypothetical protein